MSNQRIVPDLVGFQFGCRSSGNKNMTMNLDELDVALDPAKVAVDGVVLEVG